MGAKYKLLDLIIPELKEMLGNKGTLLDVMSGTQAVGYALKKSYRIVSNDIQYYSQIFAKTLIENNSISTVSERVRADFENLVYDDFHNGWFTRTYADSYFSAHQCDQISAIRHRIANIENEILQNIYLTALSTSMSTCQSSSGHFAQFMPKDNPRIKVLRNMDIFDYFLQKCHDIEIEISNEKNYVFGMEIDQLLVNEEFLAVAKPGSVLYLDPPYTTAQYSRYYHLLETVFLNDNPEVKFKGLYRQDRFQSSFSSQSQVRAAFERVLSRTAINEHKLLISYADTGIFKVDELMELCKKYFTNVQLKKMKYPHSMQGRGQSNEVHEIIIKGFN